MSLFGVGALPVAAVFVVAGLFGAGPAVPDEAGPDVQVTDDKALSRTHEASNLQRSNQDPDTAFLSEVELQTGDCRLYVTQDRGATWQPVEPTVDSPLEFDEETQTVNEPAPEEEPHTDCTLGSTTPQNVRTELQQAPDGTLYYAFHAHDPSAGGSRSVLLAQSTDQGESWTTTVVAEGPQADGPEEVELNFEPHVAIDGDNPERVVVMWRRSFPRVEDGEDRPTRPWMAISHDGGESFDKPFMMIDEDMGFDGPRPLFVDGSLYAFYRVRPSGDDEDEPTRLFAAVSEDEGESWEESQIAAAADASEPIPLYDEDREKFLVVWHDNRNDDLDVFASRSDDATEWSEPQRLNDDEVGNRVGQYYPQVSLSPGGRLDVAWYDYRDDPTPRPQPEEGEPLNLGSNLGEVQAVYLTSSTDGGETWHDNVKVNNVRIDRTIGTWNGDYFIVVPVSLTSWDDSVLVSWSDTRNGNASTQTQDIYASRVTASQDGGLQLGAWLIGGAGVLIGAGIALLAAVALLRRSAKPSPA